MKPKQLRERWGTFMQALMQVLYVITSGATFLLFMVKLYPMLVEGLLPWHELVVQSNDYPGEGGCRVTVRSHLESLQARLCSRTSRASSCLGFY